MGGRERICGHSFLGRAIGRAVVSFTFQPLRTRRKSPVVSIGYDTVGFGAGVCVMAKRKILFSAGNRIRVLQTVIGHFIYCLLRDHNIKAVVLRKSTLNWHRLRPIVVVTAVIDSVSFSLPTLL